MMAKIRSMAALARQTDTYKVHPYEAKHFPKESTAAFATSTASLSFTLGPPTNQPRGSPLQGQANSQEANESIRNINRLMGICNAHENGHLGQPTTESAIETNHQTSRKNSEPSHTTNGDGAKLTNEKIHDAKDAGYPAHEATDVECDKKYNTIKACSIKNQSQETPSTYYAQVQQPSLSTKRSDSSLEPAETSHELMSPHHPSQRLKTKSATLRDTAQRLSSGTPRPTTVINSNPGHQEQRRHALMNHLAIVVSVACKDVCECPRMT